MTKFNCSKRLHQQALSTPIRARPFVSGQGVRRFCPSARNPDSSQTWPSCGLTRQITPVNGGSGPNAAAVWIAASCLHCRGFSVTRLLPLSWQPLGPSSLSFPSGGALTKEAIRGKKERKKSHHHRELPVSILSLPPSRKRSQVTDLSISRC